MMDELALLALAQLEEYDQLKAWLRHHQDNLQHLDLNQQDEAGRTLLHYLSTDPEMVRLLLRNGADPNVRDEQGETPLHIAVRHNVKRSADLLLAAGADPLAANAEQRTPLGISTEHRNIPLLVLMMLRLDLDNPKIMQALQSEAQKLSREGMNDMVQVLAECGVSLRGLQLGRSDPRLPLMTDFEEREL